MITYDQVEKLATETNAPCVTISMNTNSTSPNNANDTIALKNLLKEAAEKVEKEYDKKLTKSLFDKMALVEGEIDQKHNLKSLSIYLSNDTQEYIQSEWPIQNNAVHISNSFFINALIKSYNRSEAYLILVISKNSINLYEALNEEIINEVINEDLPISGNTYSNALRAKNDDTKHTEDIMVDFFNKVDKCILKVYNENNLKCVVIGTEDNYTRIIQSADNQHIYYGFHNIDYNNISLHQIAKQGWDIVQQQQHNKRTEAITEMKEAVSKGNVITNLEEIYQMALDGRGELLIVHEDFIQQVIMETDRTFRIVNENNEAENKEDITSKIAWQVMSKKGRVIFTTQEEIKEIGLIALKTRY